MRLVAVGSIQWCVGFAAMLGLASVQRERGDFSSARAALQAAGAFLRSKFPAPNHRIHTTALIESGRLHLATGSFAAAQAELSEAAAKNETKKARSPAEVVTLAALAQAEQALGKSEHALALAQKASAIATNLVLLGEPSYWVGYCLLVRSELERAAGDEEAARRRASRALAQLLPTVGPDHPHTRDAQARARD